MLTNIAADPFAAPPVQSPAAPPTVFQPADADELRSMNSDQLADELLARIAAAEQRTLNDLAMDPLHVDGSVAIDSMTAVSALASIGGTVGKPRLVNLSQVDKDDLHSVAGLARVVRIALLDLFEGQQ